MSFVEFLSQFLRKNLFYSNFNFNFFFQFSNEFEVLYNRNDSIGKLMKKYLYGPTLSNEATIHANVERKRRNEASYFEKPRINLRKFASYKFIFYFGLSILILKIITGLSIVSLFISASFLFFFYYAFKI